MIIKVGMTLAERVSASALFREDTILIQASVPFQYIFVYEDEELLAWYSCGQVVIPTESFELGYPDILES